MGLIFLARLSSPPQTPVSAFILVAQLYCIRELWLVVEPTHLKNMSVKMGSSSPIFGVKIRNLWVATTQNYTMTQLSSHIWRFGSSKGKNPCYINIISHGLHPTRLRKIPGFRGHCTTPTLAKCTLKGKSLKFIVPLHCLISLPNK